jgi:hypothetical protein
MYRLDAYVGELDQLSSYSIKLYIPFSKPTSISLMHTCCKALPGFFLLYFQLPYLPEETNLYSASGIFNGRYQPGCTGIFLPVEGASQPVTLSKK